MISDILLFTVSLPVLAILLSLWAKNPFARAVLRYGGAFFLVTFGLSWGFERLCGFNDFAFDQCPTPALQSVADVFSRMHLWNLAVFVFVAPMLLVLAAVFEVISRATGEMSGKGQ